MGRRRKKEGNLFTAIAVLIALPFLLYPDKANSFLHSFFGVAVKFFIICVIGYLIYHFFLQNKFKEEDLKRGNFISRKPVINRKSKVLRRFMWISILIRPGWKSGKSWS